MVLACAPVASLMRFAARPVGAMRAAVMPKFLRMCKIHFIIVVLPVPGPPVTNTKPLLMASEMALFWSS